MAEPELDRDPRGPSERDPSDPSPKTRNERDMRLGSDTGARAKTPELFRKNALPGPNGSSILPLVRKTCGWLVLTTE